MRIFDMRYLWLDGLRGFAAFVVLSFHYFAGTNSLANFGWLAVDFFFVLSGFVLCKAITHAGNNGVSGLKTFVKKRILRLYPVLFLALSFKLSFQLIEYSLELLKGDVGTRPAFDSSDPARYVLSILLLQFLFPFSISLLLPLWSLSTEFYSSIFQIILRLTGSLRSILLGILLGVFLIIISGVYFEVVPNWQEYNTWVFGFGRTIIGFNVGQLMWHFHQRNLRLRQKYLSFLTLIGITLSMNIWLFASDLVLVSAFFWFGCLVLAVSKFKNPAKTSILSPILKVLGETAYPIYLFHMIFLDFLSSFFTNRSIGNFVFFYVVNLIFSFFVLKYLEQKVKSFIKRLIKV